MTLPFQNPWCSHICLLSADRWRTPTVLTISATLQTAAQTKQATLTDGSRYYTESYAQATLTDGSRYYTESYAQVATSVTHAVLQRSCGLKPKGLKSVKSQTLSVRFQAGELVIVKTKAQLAGVSTNSYIRASALGSDYKQPINPELQKILLATNRELTAQGNNLNQIAKRLHTGTIIPAQAVAMLDAIRVPLVRALLAIKNALVQGASQP